LSAKIGVRSLAFSEIWGTKCIIFSSIFMQENFFVKKYWQMVLRKAMMHLFDREGKSKGMCGEKRGFLCFQ